MSRFRAFLLWALMLAVPFQGYAAASMMLCAGGRAAPAAAVVDGHDHATHAHGAATLSEESSDSKASQAGPSALHSCANCASCGNCHAVTMTDAPVITVDPPPQADLAEPFHAIASVPPRVLDKPPRA